MSAEREHEVDDRIADWVDGRLDGRDRERFVAELRVNAQLRADLERYERTVTAVRAALQAPTQPVQLADRVLAAIAAGAAQPARPVASRRGPLLWSLGCAAALLLIGLLVDAWSAAPPDTNLTARFDESGPSADPNPPADADLVAGSAEMPTAPTASLEELLADGSIRARTTGSDRIVGVVGAAEEAKREQARRLSTPTPGDGALQPESAAPPLPTVAPAEEQAPGDARVAGETRRPGATGRPEGSRQKGAEDRAAKDKETPPSPDTIRLGLLGQVTDEARENATERDRAVPAGDPLPLIVVLGNAPAASDLFAARARKSPKGDPAGGAVRGALPRGDDAGRRFDEFFTAQVAELAQPVAKNKPAARPPASRVSGSADLQEDEVRDQIAAWVAVADVRLRRLEDREEAPVAAGARERVATWVERDWLVEGSREGIATMLSRLATFTAEAQLELRTGETTSVTNERVPAANPASGGAPAAAAADLQRIVLRFRLQPR